MVHKGAARPMDLPNMVPIPLADPWRLQPCSHPSLSFFERNIKCPLLGLKKFQIRNQFPGLTSHQSLMNQYLIHISCFSCGSLFVEKSDEAPLMGVTILHLKCAIVARKTKKNELFTINVRVNKILSIILIYL